MTVLEALAQKKSPLYEQIANALAALDNCRKRDTKTDWEDIWEDRIAAMARELPSGCGFDTQPKIDIDAIRSERIEIYGSYHRMDEHGGYRGWIDYRVILTPSFIGGLNIKVVGGNADFKDYCADVFLEAVKRAYSHDTFAVDMKEKA
jgi:hypothetical protein